MATSPSISPYRVSLFFFFIFNSLLTFTGDFFVIWFLLFLFFFHFCCCHCFVSTLSAHKHTRTAHICAHPIDKPNWFLRSILLIFFNVNKNENRKCCLFLHTIWIWLMVIVLGWWYDVGSPSPRAFPAMAFLGFVCFDCCQPLFHPASKILTDILFIW